MEKPLWRRRASRYVVDSPYMRLRADEVELPDGTIVRDYYVRESRGFVTIFALTGDERVILVRQYRYGTDAIHMELPAGMLLDDETPRDCALRELAEETGYRVERYVGLGARNVVTPKLDPTEYLEVELASVDSFRTMLRDGTIDAGASIAAGYRALDYLRRL
jgi:ADP-ribose pyrophosphatase